ncbi:hypothetical protein LOC68_12365 [Blastopirellula sp. JC732]|uniref:Uncharacterized protein n=1 Tax=Blastopirellula sediminis TaxID=2894196 RepID=A0A9X1MPF0_9BACT|nr:hypothetical protein [Blastopirellula sediminis]MCC9607513.1 hypothetical protein [Blastopirellula sediminis]MCC9629194.1 hypothetical protein [Blastopirellula sediminis]
MIAVLLGVIFLSIGVRAFTKTGLPLAPGLSITGVAAKVVGVCCCLLGCAIIGYVFYANFIFAQEAARLIDEMEGR